VKKKKRYWRVNGQFFPKFDENNKFINPRRSTIPKDDDTHTKCTKSHHNQTAENQW
jgi:hypothetical protein